jgi:lipopolysaccharide/colanic/teichoic acid biosynthesis glycosyltransferase
VGWWLRRLKIDELPQLWNVMRGDMSLVGSRPVIPALAVEFEADYVRLLAARPGLTDPATLKYRRETELMSLVPDPLVYFKTVIMPDKLRLSLAYLECSTFRSDVGMLMRTAVALMPSVGSMLAGRWGTEAILAVAPQKLIRAAELDAIP